MPTNHLSTYLLAPLMAIMAIALFVAPLVTPQTAHAQSDDARSRARAHYQKGNSFYTSGSFKEAIGEFAAADKLAPSPLLEFNIALCHDRLGDSAEAIRRYRLYLEAVPNASNRSDVEGKIRRIQGELRKESEARDRAKTDAAAVAAKGAAAKAAADAAALKAATPPTPTHPATPIATGPIATGPIAPTGSLPGSLPPATGPAITNPAAPVYEPTLPATNDPELARVSQVNIATVRDQRRAGGFTHSRAATAGSAAGSAGMGQASPQPPVPTDTPQKATPIYKKWWFWVIVGVGAVIVIDGLSSDTTGNRSQPVVGARGLEWSF